MNTNHTLYYQTCHNVYHQRSQFDLYCYCFMSGTIAAGKKNHHILYHMWYTIKDHNLKKLCTRITLYTIKHVTMCTIIYHNLKHHIWYNSITCTCHGHCSHEGGGKKKRPWGLRAYGWVNTHTGYIFLSFLLSFFLSYIDFQIHTTRRIGSLDDM